MTAVYLKRIFKLCLAVVGTGALTFLTNNYYFIRAKLEELVMIKERRDELKNDVINISLRKRRNTF